MKRIKPKTTGKTIRLAEATLPILRDLREAMQSTALVSSHDGPSQITQAVSHVSRRTGATGDALLPLRAAAVAIVRDLYDGYRDVGPHASHHSWLAPFISYERG